MSQKSRVMVLFGGRSAEHEISLLSARFIVESLDPQRFEAILVGIDKHGRWQLVAADEQLAPGLGARALSLQSGAPEVSLPPRPTPGEASRLLVEAQASLPIDVVFPVLHGPMGEDGTVQGLLELSGLPYVGAGVLGSAVGMDKDVMKRLLLQAGLPVLPYVSLRKARFLASREPALAGVSSLNFPVFVKPANLGSSVGVSRVLDVAGLLPAVEQAFEFDDKVVIEQGLDHPREIECAVLGGATPLVSVPGEIVVRHSDGFYSYAAKYLDDDGASMTIPAALSEAETNRAQQLALATFDVLECEGMARVDLFLDEQRRLWVNEINTIPGFTSISMYPKLMAASGVSARELVSRLIDDAFVRGRAKLARKTTA